MANDNAGPGKEEAGEAKPTPRTLMTGIGLWHLGGTLGRGAYAHVRMATHVTGHVAACKILPALHTDRGRAFTKDEMMDAIEAHKELVILKALAGAGVPGVVGLEGVIPYRGWNYIFLSVYPQALSNYRQGDYPTLIAFFRKLMLSVACVHSLGLSHEDIKRSNILIDQRGDPVLVDFGFAHFTPRNEMVKSLGGTLDYTSPEKMRDGKYDPFANDIWSLGIVLVKLLGIPHPFAAREKDETVEEYKDRVMTTEPVWDFNPELDAPGQLGHLIRNMLETNPEARYTVLHHDSMWGPDLADTLRFLTPSMHLPIDIDLTDDIVIDVAFLAYNDNDFVLCQSLDIIRKKITEGGPSWHKQWAGMLSLWKQREETFWEDIPVPSPIPEKKKPCISASQLAKASRTSLRPLRPIALSPNVRLATSATPVSLTIKKQEAIGPAVTKPPMLPRAPVTPIRNGTRSKVKAPAIGKNKENEKKVTPPGPVSPTKAKTAKNTVLAPPRTPLQVKRSQIPADQHKLTPRRPMTRAAAKGRQIRPLTEAGPQAAQPAAEQDIEVPFIDLRVDSVPVTLEEDVDMAPHASSSTLVAPTRQNPLVVAATESKMKPRVRGSQIQTRSRDKENIPPAGEKTQAREFKTGRGT